MFFPVSRMILYQDFTWLPFILQQKINKCFGCNLKPSSEATAVHLFEMPIFFHSFLILLITVISAYNIFGNWLSFHCKFAAWMIAPQPEISASWNIPGENKGHSWLGEKWSRGNLHVFDIYILLSGFCLFENSLKILNCLKQKNGI